MIFHEHHGLLRDNKKGHIMHKAIINATCLPLGKKSDWTDYDFAKASFAEYLRKKYSKIVQSIADHAEGFESIAIELVFDSDVITERPAIQIHSDLLDEESKKIVEGRLESLLPAHFGLFANFLKRPGIAEIYAPSIRQAA